MVQIRNFFIAMLLVYSTSGCSTIYSESLHTADRGAVINKHEKNENLAFEGILPTLGMIAVYGVYAAFIKKAKEESNED